MSKLVPLNREAILDRLWEAEKAALEVAASEIVRRAKIKAPVRKIYAEGGKRRKGKTASPELIAAAVRYIQNSKRLTEKQRFNALYIARHPKEAKVAVRRRGSPNAAQRKRALLLGQYRSVSLKRKGGVMATETVFRARAGAGGTKRLNLVERGFRAKRGYTPGPSLDERLSPQGRYEIKSGRALTNEAGELIKAGDKPTEVHVGGRLRASIGYGEVGRSDTRASVRVYARAPYAKFVEFPTRHNAAQPFLLPAMKEVGVLLAPLVEDAFRARGLKRG